MALTSLMHLDELFNMKRGMLQGHNFGVNEEILGSY